ncbi:hypothetical protein JM18_003658 [Phytophthora kernoviae]|uniref:PIG-P domain-containing protein n=2 Tax=Phytophthora kernoviae TaxID=325452 RepID=A0A922APF8_9STRA|nr:hypothetical protein G195_005290 [Phytophthora kernoviae 00238/432]KAG2527266.1 hypothetical protein JM18_003658 [Phytophthora kernoviae]
MSDDLLDSMSLSDDEMLDNLADDMLMEMAEEEDISAVPSSVPPSWSHAPVAAPNNPMMAPRSGNVPDLGQMMSQMMPMMSQIFGANAGANPMFAGGNNSLQQAPVSWQELVKRHVPNDEQQDWLTTIDADATKLRIASSNQQLNKPHSKSYSTKPSTLPSAFLEADTLLGSMLTEAVRAAQLEQNGRWQELRDDVVPQLNQTGMTKVFENKFKELLRQRVANDPDYLAQKDSERFRNITAALVKKEAEEKLGDKLAESDSELVRALPLSIRSVWCEDLEGHIDDHYYRPEACVTARKRAKIITELVRTFSSMLDSRDVDYWVDSGTLLGQFRTQSVIPWDDDADFGMTMAGYEQLRDSRWSVPVGYELQVYESKLHRTRDRDWNIPARLVDKTYGFYVDVFVFTEWGVHSTKVPPAPASTTVSFKEMQRLHAMRMELFGFGGWLASALFYVLFLVWAYVPEATLESYGFTYFPSKHWAVAVPALIVVTYLFSLVVYKAVNLLSTPELSSYATILDSHTVPLPEGKTCFEDDTEATPGIGDISIFEVNHHLFSVNQSQEDELLKEE